MAARYADRVKIWDVVNESILGDGSWRQSKFQQIIGDDFTEQAFRIADAVMPDDAALLYNDYGMTTPGRRDAVVAMVKDFQEKGIRIDGIGMQGHWTMGFPALEEIETAIEILSSTGLPLHITELDLDLLGRSQFLGADVDLSRIEVTPENNPFADGALPQEESARFTQRYGELFELLVRHSDKIDRVTFWGVGDGDSWLNFWPVRGRTNFALLFDRDYQPKPAFFRVLEMGMEQ
jgi:endo-1,4-beta-xylanase